MKVMDAFEDSVRIALARQRAAFLGGGDQFGGEKLSLREAEGSRELGDTPLTDRQAAGEVGRQ